MMSSDNGMKWWLMVLNNDIMQLTNDDKIDGEDIKINNDSSNNDWLY